MENPITNSWSVIVEEDENGDILIPLSPDIISKYGWCPGDKIEFEIVDRSVIIINTSLQFRTSIGDLQ